MNDQENPDDSGIPEVPSAHAEIESTEEEMTQEDMDLEDEDFDEDEEFQFEDDDDEESEEEGDVRSLVEQIFDEAGLDDMMNELDVLTLEDAAEYLKVEYGQIRRLIKEQGLPGRKIGEEWRFLRGAIADWLRAPGGMAPAEQAPQRPEPQVQQDRGEFNQRPPRRYQDEGSGQGNYPPPRRPRYGNDQQQQGEYQPPRRPYGQRGNFGAQGGGGYQGGGGGYQGGGGQGGGGPQGGSFQGGGGGGPRRHGGPKKPKRKSLNEQRFKRLDRRKFGNEGGQESIE